jgi:hypothetical protein
MATTLARRTGRTSSAPPRRRSLQIAKLKERLKAAGKRARGKSGQSDREKTILTAAGAAAFAMLESKGISIPTVGGIDPALLIGAGLSLAGPRYIGGKNGLRAQAVGDGILALAAARAIQRGGVKVSGEDDDLSVAGVEIDDD